MDNEDSTHTHIQTLTLTHTLPLLISQASAAAPDQQPQAPASQLAFIKNKLTEAEVARRQGDTRAVFGAYKQLANLFSQQLDDHKTAVYFWEKCNEIARLTGDTECEMEASRALGIAHEALGDTKLALTYYEKLQRLTADASASDDEKKAWVLLYNANVVLAEAATAAGDLHEALALRQTCLNAATSAGDKELIGKAHYEMGQAHERLRDLEELYKVCQLCHWHLCARCGATISAPRPWTYEHVDRRVQGSVTWYARGIRGSRGLARDGWGRRPIFPNHGPPTPSGHHWSNACAAPLYAVCPVSFPSRLVSAPCTSWTGFPSGISERLPPCTGYQALRAISEDLRGIGRRRRAGSGLLRARTSAPTA